MIHTRRIFIIVLSFGIGCALTATASAQTLQLTAKHWRTFTVNQGTQTLCYIASLPIEKKGNYTKRGEPFLMVTHRNGADEVSVSSGYPYKSGQDIKVVLDGKNYQFFTQNDRAWTKDAKTDKVMVDQMIKGSRVMVYGVSQLNTNSQDIYSLSGFTAAYRKMKQLCN